MEYVRVMAHFQYTGGFGGMMPPLYDMPSYPHQPGFGADAGQNMKFNSMQQGMSAPTPTQISFQTSLERPSMSKAAIPMHSNWPQPLTPMPIMPQAQFSNSINYPASTPTESHLSPKLEEPATTPFAADSPSDGKEEDTPTLSPSSYFWNQMTLPSCSDATGTCQCGDGCACVGCLTHGGHTGQQLEDTTSTENNPFPDFSTDFSLGLGPPDFLNFNHGST